MSKQARLPGALLGLAGLAGGLVLANAGVEGWVQTVSSHSVFAVASDEPNVQQLDAAPVVERDTTVGSETPDLPQWLRTITTSFNSQLPALPSADRFLPQTPTYPTFNSYRLDQQLELYAHYLRVNGVPDVLIIGSSRSLQGIDPAVLQQALAEQGYPELKIYNFGVNGATARVMDVLVREILTPEHLPRLVIWADGSRAFNSGRPDLTYNGIASSEGYKQLGTGDRPIPLPSRTFRLPFLPQPPAPQVATDLETSGFQSVSDRFDPATYYQTHPRVSGQYDSSYVPFRLTGVQADATVAIARFARSHDISLVFVNLPLTQDYLDPIRRGYEQQFQQHMQRLANQEQFVFADLSQRWLTRNDYFADPSHLNRYGASAVARQLAIETSIPWARLNKN